MMEESKIQKLSAYLDGELSSEEVANLEQALTRDAGLRDELERLRNLDKLLQDAGSSMINEPQPIELVSAVYAQAYSDTGAPLRSPPRRQAAWPGPALAAALVMAILAFPFGYFLSAHHQDQRLAELQAQIDADRLAFAVVVSQALELRKSGETVAWHNDSSGAQGTVTPVRTFRNASGEWCREYHEELRFAEEQESQNAIACRNSEGQWVTRLIAVDKG